MSMLWVIIEQVPTFVLFWANAFLFANNISASFFLHLTLYTLPSTLAPVEHRSCSAVTSTALPVSSQPVGINVGLLLIIYLHHKSGLLTTRARIFVPWITRLCSTNTSGRTSNAGSIAEKTDINKLIIFLFPSISVSEEGGMVVVSSEHYWDLIMFLIHMVVYPLYSCRNSVRYTARISCLFSLRL